MNIERRRLLALAIVAFGLCIAAGTRILPIVSGGTGTGATLTGLVRGSATAMTAAELSGDATTSGSNVVTLQKGKKHSLSFEYGDPASSSAITVAATSTSYHPDIPFACTISRYSIAVDSGTVTVKFWKKASGTAIPTSSDSISTSGVGVSSNTVNQSTTLSDFTTTSVSAHDIMAMNVTAATAKYVTASLECDE